MTVAESMPFDVMPSAETDTQDVKSCWLPRSSASEAVAGARPLSHRDPLTGLSSRQALIDRIDRSRLRQRPQSPGAALILAGIDNFQAINDTLGHDVGDWFLRVVASRLRDAVPPVFQLARIGGDEFAVLMDGLRNAAEAHALASRIAAAFVAPVTTAGGRITATASIGIAFQDDSLSESRLLAHANMAMACAKAAGGHVSRVFDPSMHERRSRTFVLDQAIRQPQLEAQLALHYQPVIDVQSMTVCGMEALMRWHLPDIGPVSPCEFIPLAERDDTILRLGGWALREACRQLQAWRAAGLRTVPVAVNLSPRQLAQPDFAQGVLQLLAEHGLGPKAIALEITESAAMTDDDHARGQLALLADHGLRLSVDDFGTGYSCLSRLQTLPVHTLKVDRTFVSRLASGERDVAMVAAIVGLARSLGMDTIAEGVETQAQAELLRSLGCQRLQGFLYARPMQAEAAAGFLQAPLRG